MLIEQIIEFELRMPRPLEVHVFLKLAIFMTKQKSLRQYNRLKYYLMLNILLKAMYRDSLTWAKSLTKFDPKMQNFKRVLDLT